MLIAALEIPSRSRVIKPSGYITQEQTQVLFVRGTSKRYGRPRADMSRLAANSQMEFHCDLDQVGGSSTASELSYPSEIFQEP